MKFCFWGNISSALQGRTAGGAELQIALLAKALALKGHEIVIIDPYSKESFTTPEGVKLITVPHWNKGIKGLRLFFHRIPALKKMLLEQKADFYYVRMRSYLHLISYKACRKVKAKFIIATAHDLDLLSFGKKFKYEYKSKFNLFKLFFLYIPNDVVYRFLLKKSDYIILQHEDQKFRYKSKKGEIAIFPNIFDSANIPVIKNPPQNYFIHVGALSILKGTANLYQLSKILDEHYQIIIIGEPVDSSSRSIIKKLNNKSNIHLKGWLNHAETIKLIAGSKALINTSNYEGFPNIFLEAWATGVPVISLKVNPGSVLNKHRLGAYCEGSLLKMKEYIESDYTNTISRKNLISYVNKFHDISTAGERFLKIINKEN